jgi:hypothetical protein
MNPQSRHNNGYSQFDLNGPTNYLGVIYFALLQIRTDDDLLIEPHPFRLSDFTSADPLVSEIKKRH